MSILSSIVSGVKNAASSAYNYLTAPISSSSQTASVYNALNSSNPTSQSLQKQLANPAPYGSPAYYQASPTYQAATANGQNITNINSSGGLGNQSYGPTLPVTISAGKVNPNGGAGGASYGPSVPSGFSSGGGGSSNASSNTSPINTASLAPQTISSQSLTGGGTSSFASTGGGASPIGLAPSAPSATSVGKVDTTGLAGAMSAHYKRNADGTYTEIPPTDTQQSNTDIATQQKALYDQILGPKPDVYSDPAVSQAMTNRQNILQAIQAPTAELNAVVAQQNQDLLQLRQTGQREGVTEAVYGRQSDAINYNAAIRALPLQAQLANLQGQEKLASDYLTQLTQIKSSQINNQYEYNKGLFESISSVISKKDQQAFDLLKTQNEHTYQQNQDLIKAQATLMQNALAQHAPQGVITAIANGKTIQESTMAAGQYGVSGKYAFQTITDAFGNQHVVASNTFTGATGGGSVGGASTGGNGASTAGYNAPENTPYKNALEQVVQGKAPTEARPQRAQLDALLQSGNTQGAKEYLLSAALTKFGPTEQTNALGRMTAVDALKDISQKLTTLKDKGVNTNIFKGNLEQAAQTIGNSTNQELASVGNEIALAYNVYRKAMTGVAFSPAEAAQYAKIFPSLTNLDSLNQTKINSLIDSFNQQQKTVVGAAIGQSNYEKIFENNAQTNSAPVTEGKLSSGITFKVVK